MFSRARAWRQIIGIGLISGIIKEVDTFFRGNIIRVLRTEGWFDYLTEPRTMSEIMEYFHYTDQIFLKEVLDTLVEDETLKIVDGSKYQVILPVRHDWVIPRVFDEGLREVLISYSQALPNRLKNQYLPFTGSMNLYNWDDTLTGQLYERIRRTAFEFAGALNRHGKLLDIGCSNGYGTASIWVYYYKKEKIFPKSSIEIVGMDIDADLLTIAEEEFPEFVKKMSEITDQDLQASEQYRPTFVKGSALDMPFEDETFDMVYASQLLHWIDPKKALKEMLRITKPEGMIFGTENFILHRNRFNHLHYKVIEGAYGVLDKKDFIQWAKEAGAKNIAISTPLSVFKITK